MKNSVKKKMHPIRCSKCGNKKNFLASWVYSPELIVRAVVMQAGFRLQIVQPSVERIEGEHFKHVKERVEIHACGACGSVDGFTLRQRMRPYSFLYGYYKGEEVTTDASDDEYEIDPAPEPVPDAWVDHRRGTHSLRTIAPSDHRAQPDYDVDMGAKSSDVLKAEMLTALQSYVFNAPGMPPNVFPTLSRSAGVRLSDLFKRADPSPDLDQ